MRPTTASLCAVLALAAPALAHHDFASIYNQKALVTIEGDLVAVSFRNPHSLMHVAVRERGHADVRYAIEWDGASQLGEAGITSMTFKSGDHLIVTGRPSRTPADHRVRITMLRRPKDGLVWGDGKPMN